MNELIVQRELTPSVWNMIESIVATTAGPSSMKKAEIAQKMLFCYENDLPLNLAFNGGLYVINNRLEVEGIVIRAKIRQSHNYDYQIIRLDDDGCEMSIVNSDGGIIGQAGFTKEDAELAGLLTKDNYKKYPTDMYLNKATSRAYKRFCPDIFFTPVYVRGEISTDEMIIINDSLTIQDLTDQYNPALVLEAMQHTNSDNPETIREYLENQQNDKTS